MNGEIYKIMVLVGVCIAYTFSVYGFLSFLYHAAIDRNKRFAEKDKDEWFRKGFIAGCAETLDEVIKYRCDVEKQKKHTESELGKNDN